MAGGRVLADTTLFIEHLRAKDKTVTTLRRLARASTVETSAVVAAEVFYGARNAAAEQHAWMLLRPFVIHPFTLEMAARQCALLSKLAPLNRIPDLRDLMIAASALELGLPLATLNQRHFKSIPGLKLVHDGATAE